MTSEEAAKAASVSRVTIHKWVRIGKLPAQRVGKRGRIRVDAEVLAMVLAGQPVRLT